MSLEADIAAIKVRLDYLDAWAKQINERLEAGDRRFHDADVREAGEEATRKLATQIGLWALGVASAIGMWGLSQIPALIKWWLSIRS